MNRKKVLFVGHDFKFLKNIISHFSQKNEFDIDVFNYSGHKIVDHKELAAKLPSADIIFCEWGLGNLSWLSKNKFPDQRIIVRIHSQEFYTDYLKLTNWQEIDKIVLVSPHMIRHFSKLFKEQNCKTTLIHNVVDCQAYNLPKNEISLFNIGLIGILPKLKAPHIGLELLFELKKHDPRFKLNIKSKKPDELDWLFKKPDEIEYYNHFYDEIKRLNLEDSITWEGHGNDMPEWYRNNGFILSSSDRESFHMSVAEGMASGAIPIIRNWEGADQLYPKKFIFSDTREAVQIIKKYSQEKVREKEIKYIKNYAQKHFGLDVILNQYEQLFEEVVASINNNQQKISLRSIYHDISEDQKSTAEECEKKIQDSDDKISALNTELTDKNEQIKGIVDELKEKESFIHQLQIEIASKTQKADSIIAVADEIKEQLSASREREKQQSLELNELKILKEKATHVTAQLYETKTQLAITQEKLIASKERETNKENKINEIKEHLQTLQQQLNASKGREQEKDISIAKLKEKTDKYTYQIEAVNMQIADIRQQQAEAVFRENNKDLEIENLKKSLEVQGNETSTFKKQLAERDLLIQETHNKLTDGENQLKNMAEFTESMGNTITELKTKLSSLEHSVKIKQLQIVEQKQYINYLEKRFFNKIIGVLRKKLKQKQ